MKKTGLKIALAIGGVMLGLSLFITSSLLLTRALGIADLHRLLGFAPRWIVMSVGAISLGVFFPIFLSGVFFLKPKGAVGRSEHLVRHGIYRYVRNPFYAGLSMSLVGLGLLLGQTGILLAGTVWLTICFFQCLREERELSARFGHEYEEYRKSTPMLIPRFDIMIGDLMRSPD